MRVMVDVFYVRMIACHVRHLLLACHASIPSYFLVRCAWVLALPKGFLTPITNALLALM